MRAVNLIPSEQRSGGSVGAGRSGGAAYAVLALLAGFALLAVMYGKATRTVSSDESQAAALTAKAHRQKAAAEALAPYTTFVTLRKQRETAVTSLVDTRFDWAHVFHEFGRVLTDQTSISNLSGEVGAAAPEAPSAAAAPPAGATSASASAAAVSSSTPAGSIPSFTLSGCATNQKAVARMLQRLRLIDGVKEVTLQSSTRGETNGGSTTASGPCPAGAPVFSVTVQFEPLPSANEAAAAASGKPVANTTPATPAPAPTTTGGNAG
jgi:hypothetical protein